ncbi:MAG: ABC transporter ATP-binding protein [Candidatus Marinimicrobia bacterium]|nr:ABC transporter ATP-binding protein [Candidatus Neomarinimicrobiota bacterium]
MKTSRKLLRYISPYKYILILAVISSLIFAILSSTSIWMIGTLMDKVISENPTETVAIETVDQSISVNDKLKEWTHLLVGNGSPVQQLLHLCLWLVLIFILKNIFFYINMVSLAFIQNRIILDIRTSLFGHIHQLPLSYFDRSKSAELQTIMIRDVAALRASFSQSLQKLIVEPVNIIIFICLLFIIDIKLTLIALIMIPISGLVITKLGQSIRRKSKRSSIKIAGISNILQETISGIRIVKAFAMEKFETDRFISENKKFFALSFRQAKMSKLSTPINEIIGVSIGVILLWIGGSAVLGGHGLAHDDFMRFILILFALLQPGKKLGNVSAQIQAGLASADRIFNILEIRPAIFDIEDAKSIQSFDRSIQFDNVTFKYESGTGPSLKNVSVTIQKGQIVALVGRSGAGKSTFVDLIPRFYDVTDGRILLDGQDIRDLTIDSIRSILGIVMQDTILFNDTIANNISYGKPDCSHDELINAAKAANALEFIEQLPKEFDTVIGEKGTLLSGGQRQRISIARAILKNPPILIFDEATSALDTESEQKVQEAIDRLVENKTVIVIAHRLSTIRKADQIVVFDRGKVIETGTHTELMNLESTYRQFYEIQFGKNTS